MACVPIGAFIIKALPLANTNKKTNGRAYYDKFHMAGSINSTEI